MEADDDSESDCCRKELSPAENAATDETFDAAAASVMASVLNSDKTRRRRRGEWFTRAVYCYGFTWRLCPAVCWIKTVDVCRVQ